LLLLFLLHWLLLLFLLHLLLLELRHHRQPNELQRLPWGRLLLLLRRLHCRFAN
jgi:hypothetical protein